MTAKLRGFAYLKEKNPERFAEIVRKGGQSVPAHKRPYAKDPDLAASAGRKGGQAYRKNKVD